MKAGRALPFVARFGFSRSTSVLASWARDFAFFLLLLAASFDTALAFFVVAPALRVFTLSSTLRFEYHTASLAFAMPSMVRRLTTERGFSSRMSGSFGPRAASSLDLISSHGS